MTTSTQLVSPDHITRWLVNVLLIVVTLVISGCAKEQEVFDRELFLACVQATGDQYNGVYECRRTATTNKEGN